MAVTQKKICLAGEFAVGKTSMISRYVSGVFSEKYLTTVGVKIDRKDVTIDGGSVRLLIWDLAGEDEFARLRTTYLRGAAGCVLVTDVTRPETLDTALRLHDQRTETVGDIPMILALNKTDLTDRREVDLSAAQDRVPAGCETIETSARTGHGVERVFERLASRILDHQ